MRLPDTGESDKKWHDALMKMSIEEKILVKKKMEFALNDILAQNRSISLEEKRQKEFASDRFRKQNDLRMKDPKEINNIFARAHILRLKAETEEAEIKTRELALEAEIEET